MSEGRVYSERLGAIRDAQFEAAAERFALGRFLRAEPTTAGLFGQNVFVTTTDGEFVLRGAPHWVRDISETEFRREDRYQFTMERWFAQQLHERTKVAVPWPIHHDETSDVFGWPYLLMPKMPGLCTTDRAILTALAPQDRRGVAVALGENLAEMQTLTWPFAGAFSTMSVALEPYPEGGLGRVVRELHRMMQSCGERLTRDDIAWIESAIAGAGAIAASTYVHGDYQFGNLTVLKDGGRWRVGGLFDFHTSQFSDGAFDLVRLACSYLDTEPDLAPVFREAYGKSLDAGCMTLYVVTERLIIWDYFARPESKMDWFKNTTFRGWAQRYVDGILALL